jgi:8-oxo-dGTP pyrophosphatase MutT (NUDIX family)
MARSRIVYAFSAGGVVYRCPPDPASQPSTGTASALESVLQVILVGRAADDFWVLPKGTPEQGETREQVALREVAEETGVKTRIISELGSIRYDFTRQGRRYSKEVLYYLMEPIGGDVSLHDHEYDDARWFQLDAATQHLAYANEADILRSAVPRIRERLKQQQQSAAG